MSEVELQPETEEVLQAEHDEDYATVVVPVCVEEIKSPVRTQALPRKTGSTRTRSIGAKPVRVLTADPYRAKAVLTSTSAFSFSFSGANASDTSMMSWWPANTPCVIECVTDVWVVVGDTTADVSITTERWAAG